MDQVSIVCRRRHLSRRTEEAYRFWIRRYIYFHAKRHPSDVGPTGIVAFVNDLAARQHVAASTQSQAFNALLFLYRDVLDISTGSLAGLRRIQRLRRLPVVLSTDEVRATLVHMVGTPRLIAELLYGTGLRVTNRLGPCWGPQACERTYPAPFVCDSSVGRRDGYTNHPATTRSSEPAGAGNG